MKRLIAILVMAILLLSPVSQAFASIEVQLNGSLVGGFAIRLNFTGDVNVTGVGSDKTIRIGGAASAVTTDTTDTTVTAAETGKTFFVNAARGQIVTMTLPDAAIGLKYTFVASDEGKIRLTPQSGDTIAFAPSSIPLDAGDRLLSSGQTADSITVVARSSSVWEVVSVNGTWADNAQ